MNEPTTVADARLVGDRGIVWDPEHGMKLYEEGYFGQPVGIRKPKSSVFNKPLELSLIECVYLTRNLLEHGLGSVPPVVFRPTGIGMSGYIERKQYYRIKKQLIPILLKHLNDNHFCIRAACYQSFATLVERHRPSSDGRYSIEKPKTLPNPIQWERESWWNCRDEQRKLLSWWEDNGEFVLRNYGPDWIAPAK